MSTATQKTYGSRVRDGGNVRRPRRRASRLSVLSLAPFVVFSAVLLFYPFSQVVRMGFSHINLTAHGFHYDWAGLQNFDTVVHDRAAMLAVVHTLIFIAAAGLGTLVAGTLGALIVNRAVTMLPLARNVAIWPAAIAPVVVSLMWLLILNPNAGGLNKVLTSLGLPTQAWLSTSRGAMTSLVVVDIWHWTPIVFLFVYTALQNISADLYEAARLDGASERAILRHVVLPLLRPAIFAVAVVRIVMGIKVFDEMYLLTSGGPNGATTLVSQQIQIWFFHDIKFGSAAAFGLLVVLGTTVLLAVAFLTRARAARVR